MPGTQSFESWTALAAAVESPALDDQQARKRLCLDECLDAPPWVVRFDPPGERDLPSVLEVHLVVARPGGGLLLSEALVTLPDFMCQGWVTGIEIVEGERGPKALIAIDDAVDGPPYCDDADDEVCDNSCYEEQWTCEVEYDPETLEIFETDCERPGPRW